jgi:hypothetical protein
MTFSFYSLENPIIKACECLFHGKEYASSCGVCKKGEAAGLNNSFFMVVYAKFQTTKHRTMG